MNSTGVPTIDEGMRARRVIEAARLLIGSADEMTLDMDAMRQAIASVDTSALTDSTLDDSQEFLFFYGREADSRSWYVVVGPRSVLRFNGPITPTARRVLAAIDAVLDADAMPSEE